MINVLIHKKNAYKVPVEEIKKRLNDVLKGKAPEEALISVAFVGRKKMNKLVKKYYKNDPENLYIHPILTFPYKDKDCFGEIIISWDDIESEANLLDLIEHGALHLIGIHH